jgi:hypothetical protein
MAGGTNAPAGARSVEDGRFNGRFTPTGKAGGHCQKRKRNATPENAQFY